MNSNSQPTPASWHAENLPDTLQGGTRIVYTQTSQGAADIRREAIAAIEKIADERLALWKDYLSTVKHLDDCKAKRDAAIEACTALLTWVQARCFPYADDPWGKSAVERTQQAIALAQEGK